MARRKKWTEEHSHAKQELISYLETYIGRVEKQPVSLSEPIHYNNMVNFGFTSEDADRKRLLAAQLHLKDKRLRGFNGLRIMRYLNKKYAAFEREQEHAESIVPLEPVAGATASVTPFELLLPLEIRRMIYTYALPEPRVVILTLKLDKARFWSSYPLPEDYKRGNEVIGQSNRSRTSKDLPMGTKHIHNAAPPRLLALSSEARALSKSHYIEIDSVLDSAVAAGFVDFGRDTLCLRNEEITNMPQHQNFEDFFVDCMLPHLHKIRHLIIDDGVWGPETPGSCIWSHLVNLDRISVVFHDEICGWCNNLHIDIEIPPGHIESNPRHDQKTRPFILRHMPACDTDYQQCKQQLDHFQLSLENYQHKSITFDGPFVQLVDGERCCELGSNLEVLVCLKYNSWLPNRCQKLDDR